MIPLRISIEFYKTIRSFLFLFWALFGRGTALLDNYISQRADIEIKFNLLISTETFYLILF